MLLNSIPETLDWKCDEIGIEPLRPLKRFIYDSKSKVLAIVSPKNNPSHNIETVNVSAASLLLLPSAVPLCSPSLTSKVSTCKTGYSLRRTFKSRVQVLIFSSTCLDRRKSQIPPALLQGHGFNIL